MSNGFNFDDIITDSKKESFERPENTSKEKKQFSKEEWAAKKKQERDAVYQMLDRTAENVVMSGDNFKQFLDIQSQFLKYSASNILLIQAQMPEATVLKDFESWKAEGRNINKRERGVRILEPGREYTREDGTISNGYQVKKVFDISQTSPEFGYEEPDHTSRDERKTGVDKKMLVALIQRIPCEIVTVEKMENSNEEAYFDKGKNTLYVKKGLDAEPIFKSITKELYHLECARLDPTYIRSDHIFEAQCASYLMCKMHGVDVSDYKVDKVPGRLKNMDAKEIRGVLNEIRDTTQRTEIRIYKNLKVMEEKNKAQER